jgi:hypothetical protein
MGPRVSKAHHQMLAGIKIASRILPTRRETSRTANGAPYTSCGWLRTKKRAHAQTGTVASPSVVILAHSLRHKSPIDVTTATKLNREGSPSMTTNPGQFLRSWLTQTVPHSPIPHTYKNGRDPRNWTAATATMEAGGPRPSSSGFGILRCCTLWVSRGARRFTVRI